MGSRKAKVKFYIPREELAATFQHLGEQVDSGELSIGETVLPLDGFTSLKVKIKDCAEGCRVSINAKYPPLEPAPEESASVEPCGCEAGEAETGEGGEEAEGAEEPAEAKAPGLPKYKKLKKRMDDPWKDILEALEVGRFPEADMCKRFVADCRLMISYPDEGPEFYAAFRIKLDDFAVALDNQDLEGLRSAARAMDQLKKACHDKHK